MASIPASYWECWDQLQHLWTLIKKHEVRMDPEEFSLENDYKEYEKQLPIIKHGQVLLKDSQIIVACDIILQCCQ